MNLTSLHRPHNIHHQINFIHHSMQRTQIYLTESEHQGLQRLAESRKSTLSAVIRDAVDRYLQAPETSDWQARRLAALGLWADHAALPDLDSLRREERFADWER